MRNDHQQHLSSVNSNHKASTSNGVATIRCVLVGDACVGKTSLIVAYTRNGFSDRYVPTAFDNYSVTVNVDGKPLKLELCDTAGRSEFDTIRPLSYEDANIFLLCFSVVKPETLKAVTERWLPELRAVGSTVPVILVGTQNDLRLCRFSNDQTGVPTDSTTLTRIASQYHAEYIECSAVTQRNLKEVFDLAILYGLNRRSAPKIQPQNPSTSLRNCSTSAKSKSNGAIKTSKKGDKIINSRNGLSDATNISNNGISARGLNASALNKDGNITANGNLVKRSAKTTVFSGTKIANGAPLTGRSVDRCGTENKLTPNYSNNNHNANGFGFNGGKAGQEGFSQSSPYGNWLMSSENHHRPTIKSSTGHGSAASNFTFETHTTSTKSPPTTTFKNGFRKLISMTRRFL